MPELLLGTDDGVLRLRANGTARREDGPPDVAFFARAADGLYALTREGALWRAAGDEGWRLVNPRPVGDEVWSFAADPRLPGRLYLGVSPALLYRSADGGETWTACESVRRIPGYERWTFPPPPHIPHVRSIAPDPLVAGAVYIGVEEGGVYRSPDGGETWESLNEGLYWDVHVVLPAPDGHRLYATTGAGFYRSADGGRTWEQRMDGLDRRYTVSLALSPARPERLYVAAAATPPPGWREGANAALYASDDAGETWRRLMEGLPDRLDDMVSALVANEDGGVYAAAGGTLYVSHDGGETWQRLAAGLPRVRALAL